MSGALNTQRKSRAFWMNLILAALSLYFFLCAINVMGSGLKIIGKETQLACRCDCPGRQPTRCVDGLGVGDVNCSEFIVYNITHYYPCGGWRIERRYSGVCGHGGKHRDQHYRPHRVAGHDAYQAAVPPRLRDGAHARHSKCAHGAHVVSA